MSETGLHMCFRSLYRRSLPGSRINEDGSGLAGGHAWIIDGATGVAAERMTPGESDAAWLTGTVETMLVEFSRPGRSSVAILSDLQASLERTFADVATGEGPADAHLAPSACLGFLSLKDNGCRLEGAFLGDVVALVPTAQGILRWTDERAKPFEQMTLAALGDGGDAPGGLPEGARRQIMENRARLNRPDGYWVVSPRRAFAGRELRFQAAVAPGAPLVLATDGFMRLVDVFRIHTDASLHAALAAGAGDDLMRQLRDLEKRDDRAGAHRRVKTHDDATVMVIAAEP